MLLQENVLFEAEKTCDFICQLSSYLPQWRVSSPESVHQLQVIPRPLGQFLLNSMDTDGCIDNILVCFCLNTTYVITLLTSFINFF